MFMKRWNGPNVRILGVYDDDDDDDLVSESRNKTIYVCVHKRGFQRMVCHSYVSDGMI
jgi:hypothetical protein